MDAQTMFKTDYTDELPKVMRHEMEKFDSAMRSKIENLNKFGVTQIERQYSLCYTKHPSDEPAYKKCLLKHQDFF